jgi:hypothetical protein
MISPIGLARIEISVFWLHSWQNLSIISTSNTGHFVQQRDLFQLEADTL